MTTKTYAFIVRGYGEMHCSSLTLEATSRTGALKAARQLEWHPTFQLVYSQYIGEVAG